MKKHYIHEIEYYAKTYTTDLNGNKKSAFGLDRHIFGYFNQSNDNYKSEGTTGVGKEYTFTCDYNEDIDSGNYIVYLGNKYTIQNVSKHNGITQGFTRITLINQN